MSAECIQNGDCPALAACDAAGKALIQFGTEHPEADRNFLAEQELLIEMRRLAITETACVIDCTTDTGTPKSPFTCPLPFGMTENTAFGPQEEMRRSALTIVNSRKPKGFQS